MKKALLIALLPLLGCQANNHRNSANEELVGKVFSAFNRHDWKEMVTYYADPADFLDPSLGKDYVKQTHEQSLQKYAGLQSFAPDVNDSVVGMYSDGDKVIVEFISTGTTNGEKWSLPFCDVFTIKDGKVMRDATYYDR